jgi:hypothetical protein
MSFHDLHDLASAALNADFSLLLEGLEAGAFALVATVLALVRGAH